MRFCVFFADSLLFLLLPPSPFAVLPCASGVLLHLRCCVCHIFTVLAVVPGVSLCVCFVFSCFWGRVSVVSALFLLFFSLCYLCGVEFSGFWWCVVLCCVVSVCWVCCLWCVCLLCVLFLVGCLVMWLCPRFCGVVASGVWCVFASGWCLCSSVGSVLFWVVRCFVVLLVLVVCGCSSWLLLFFWLVVVAVLLSPLFWWSCSWFSWLVCSPPILTQNATLVGWLCGVSASGG